jgi:hypothetical protein
MVASGSAEGQALPAAVVLSGTHCSRKVGGGISVNETRYQQHETFTGTALMETDLKYTCRISPPIAGHLPATIVERSASLTCRR